MLFIPSWGQNRLHAFLEHRTEWCISRQRSWGTPIPALFNTQTGETFISSTFVNAVADRVAQEGVEYWERVTIAELRADGMLPAALATVPDEAIIKERDILDVWFDAGISHKAAVENDGQALPVDVYLEGLVNIEDGFKAHYLVQCGPEWRAANQSDYYAWICC